MFSNGNLKTPQFFIFHSSFFISPQVGNSGASEARRLFRSGRRPRRPWGTGKDRWVWPLRSAATTPLRNRYLFFKWQRGCFPVPQGRLVRARSGGGTRTAESRPYGSFGRIAGRWDAAPPTGGWCGGQWPPLRAGTGEGAAGRRGRRPLRREGPGFIIASQCSHWRGNPFPSFPFSMFSNGNLKTPQFFIFHSSFFISPPARSGGRRRDADG